MANSVDQVGGFARKGKSFGWAATGWDARLKSQVPCSPGTQIGLLDTSMPISFVQGTLQTAKQLYIGFIEST